MDSRRKDKFERQQRNSQRRAGGRGDDRSAGRGVTHVPRPASGSVMGKRLSRPEAKRIAEETVEICESGCYPDRKGKVERVDLSDALQTCREGTEVVVEPSNTALRYKQGMHADFVRASGHPPSALGFAKSVLGQQRRTAAEKETDCPSVKEEEAFGNTPMVVEVVLETTLSGIRNLCAQDFDVCALNFASAKNPGGGFLKGSTAQEEALARTTGIYHAIGSNAAQELYSINRSNNRNCLYADALAYSPGVPIFRDDDCKLLPRAEICRCAFVTCPAVNAKHAAPRTSVAEVQRTMLGRICRIVSEMERRGHNAVVLGSYGCGVFGNNVEDVAKSFVLALAGRKFSRVRFSVIAEYDARVFREAFDLTTETSDMSEAIGKAENTSDSDS